MRYLITLLSFLVVIKCAATPGNGPYPIPGGGGGGAMRLTNVDTRVGFVSGGNVGSNTTAFAEIASLGNAAYANSNGFLTVIHPNGVSDSTVRIQASVRTNSISYFEPGDYFITNTITLPNNSVIIGNGATFHFNTNYPNFAIYCPTNSTNFTIKGLNVDGGYSYLCFASSGAGLTNINSYLPNVIGYGPFINHSGFYINMGGGGTIENCTAYGFPGYGFFFLNTNQYVSYQKPRTMLGRNTAFNNYLGVWPSAWQFDTGFGDITNVQEFNSEYISIDGWNITSNGQGVAMSAGNSKILNCDITANFIGIGGNPGANIQHGEVANNTVNHNQFSIFIGSAGYAESINHNRFYANPNGMFINGSTELKICFNEFDASQVVITNNGTPSTNNDFIGNTYQGLWGNTFLVANWGNVSNRIYGNHSSDNFGDSDGSIQSKYMAYSSVITNVIGSTAGAISFSANTVTIPTNFLSPTAGSQLSNGLGARIDLAVTNLQPTATLGNVVVSNGIGYFDFTPAYVGGTNLYLDGGTYSRFFLSVTAIPVTCVHITNLPTTYYKDISIQSTSALNSFYVFDTNAGSPGGHFALVGGTIPQTSTNGSFDRFFFQSVHGQYTNLMGKGDFGFGPLQ